MNFSLTFDQQIWILAVVLGSIAFYLTFIKLKIYKAFKW